MIANKVILAILKDEGVSQTELARRLGVSKQAVHQMLSHEDILLSSLIKILHLLGYDFIIERRRNNR